MKVLVVGGGGREHAVISKLKENDKISEIFAYPGNGGIAADAVCVGSDACDIDGIVKFAVGEKIDFAVVTPDNPLVMGCVDELEKRGIACFGPVKRAAIIEGSKIFAKELMKKYSIPTARYESFDDASAALEYLKTAPLPAVIKADGLALGKGVIIANTRSQAEEAVLEMMRERRFGESGSRIVIEEFLEGPEVSVLSFTDGKSLVPLLSSQDHKRALDGDKGLNTGGMGVVAPNPFYTKEIAEECFEKIFMPTLRAMNAEGRSFKGCLYFGLMLTKDGPKVIEYNCRFGDPEAQAVLPLLETDLLDIMLAVSEERLSDIDVKFKKGCSCCLVLASKGYPEKYEKGFEISFAKGRQGVFVAGARLENGKLLTNGGRVLSVVRRADSLKEAVDSAYAAAADISFENVFYRKDIGQRALSVLAKN